MPPLVPTIGRLGAIYLASGTSVSLADEPMEEVNLLASEGRPRYTVYQITDIGKRNLDDSQTPTFTYKSGGTGDPIALTPYQVDTCDCRIYLSTALSSGDTVACATGKYIPVSMVQGVQDYTFNSGWNEKQYMLLRDTAERTALLNRKWDASATVVRASTCATYATSLTGTKNNITFTHTPGGTPGNGATGGYTVTYSDPGGTTATLSISISGNDITVNLGRKTSAINTTALDLVNLWGANAILRERGVMAQLKAGEDGSGLLTSMTKKNLSGGLDPVDWAVISGAEDKCVAVFYDDFDTEVRWVDYARIISDTKSYKGSDLEMQTLKFQQWGGHSSGPFRHVG
jgi:hypothetical protein